MYQPLDTDEIRLIDLHPGEFDDEITCTLRTVSLRSDPLYEALSYVWGDPNIRSEITVQGAPMHVTVNLKSALRYLRSRDKPMTLWVDAVCINQNDVTERGQQVGQMGAIFQKARGAIIWLGEQSSDIDLIFHVFEAVALNPKLHFDSYLQPSLMHIFKEKEVESGVVAFLDRPWWQRLWTVQESVLPIELTFRCGYRQASSTTIDQFIGNYLYHSAGCCREESQHHALAIKMVQLISLFASRTITSRHQAVQCLNQYRSRLCLDLRDKAYGLLGLIAWHRCSPSPMIPDYSLSTEQVYESIAVRLLTERNALKFLSCILPLPTQMDDDEDHRLVQLPSWVPNWAAKLGGQEHVLMIYRLNHLEKFTASGTLESNATYQAPGRLILRGIIVGSIARIAGSCGEIEEWARIIDTLQTFREMVEIDRYGDEVYPCAVDSMATLGPSPDRKPMSYSEAYYSTISSSLRWDDDDRKHRRYPATELKTLGMMFESEYMNPERIHHKESDLQPTEKLKSAYDYYPIALRFSILRRGLFITDPALGLMGLAPSTAKTGDMIVIFEGGHVPYIIRRATGNDSENSWYFIGDSYVEGLMDGEALELGPWETLCLV